MLVGCGSGSGGGTPSKDAPWVGNTYALTIPSANWTQPPGVGGDIGAFVPQFLIGVSQSSGDTMTVTLGTATNGADDAAVTTQDPCNVTTQVAVDGSGYPNATITAPAFPLRIVNTAFKPAVVVDTTARNFTLTNVLPDGGTTAENGTLSVVLDISELYPLFNLVPTQSRTKDGVCEVLANAGATCTTCPTTGQPYCLTLKASQLGAVETTTAVMPIASTQVPPSCVPTGESTPPAEEAGAPNDAGNGPEPSADAGAPLDATAPVDGSLPDAGSSGHLDAQTAADAPVDSQ
jgi:hypothetical protein